MNDGVDGVSNPQSEILITCHTSHLSLLMKALRYFFCIVLPPVAVLMTGRLGSFFLSLILTLLGWIPGIIHACLVVNDYHEEQRAARYSLAR